MSWKKSIYIAKKISGVSKDKYGNIITTYEEPKHYMFNVQPISSEVDLMEFGEKAKMMQKAVIPISYQNKFKENDLAYLDGANPTNEVVNGNNANYRLYPPRNGNKVIIIYFERITGK